MASMQPLIVAAKTLRIRIPFRFDSTSAGPPPPVQSCKWEGWELPVYITSFLTIVILGDGQNAKPDLSVETSAHQKALERLEMEKLAFVGDSSD